MYKADAWDRITIILLKQLHGTKGLEDELNDMWEVANNSGDAWNIRVIESYFKLAMINTAIFVNEDEVRALSDKPDLTESEWANLGRKLLKTHKLNADRSKVKAMISEFWMERIDPKLNYVKGEWVI